MNKTRVGIQTTYSMVALMRDVLELTDLLDFERSYKVVIEDS
jgi:hypothetical protein